MNRHEHQMLVPLDTSALSEAVLPLAATLAQATGSTLILLHVVAPAETLVALPDLLPAETMWTLPPPASGPTLTSQEWEATEVARAQSYLAAVAGRLTAAGLAAHPEVVVAPKVAEAVCSRAARDPGIVRIAMTTHGYSGFRYWTMGSVAEQVLHATPVPLLLMRAREACEAVSTAASVRTILVPLDGSVFAEQALQEAQALAAALGATLLLLTAVPAVDGIGGEGGINARWTRGEREVEEEQLAHYLEQLAQQLTAVGLSVRTQVVSGSAAETIVRVSAEAQADLIVMATHGRSGLRRVLLGSVADAVLRSTETPVLLYRPSASLTHTDQPQHDA
jgi:nucleotide-binding universal stress UspA family protein